MGHIFTCRLKASATASLPPQDSTQHCPSTAQFCCFYDTSSNLFSTELKARSLTHFPFFSRGFQFGSPFLSGCLVPPAYRVASLSPRHFWLLVHPTTHINRSWALPNREPVLAGSLQYSFLSLLIHHHTHEGKTVLFWKRLESITFQMWK